MDIIYNFALILFGAAFFGTLFVYLKLPIILAYILTGVIAGPVGLQLVSKAEHLNEIGELGIIFLLFLMGLHLPLSRLATLFKSSAIHTFISAPLFGIVSAGILYLLGFQIEESLCAGVCMMFSSTVISLKLIPTTALHHQRIGAVMTSVLLIEDIVAIAILILMIGNSGDTFFLKIKPFITLLVLLGSSLLMVKYVLLKLLVKFDTIQEYLFLLALGWCFGMAELAKLGGASYEIGAFIAGVALATSPIALIIAEHLKPLREFFLILFFFTIGAQFDYNAGGMIWISASILAVALLLIKPFVLSRLFRWQGEAPAAQNELGWRLGQVSEFGLLISYAFQKENIISYEVYNLINITIILGFIISTYIVVKWYPTPIGMNTKTRRD